MSTWRCSGGARSRCGGSFCGCRAGFRATTPFSRIFRLLDPLGFEACFARYLAALSERVQGVVALDGKTVRRSFDRQQGRAPLPLISAWACETRLVLGQLRRSCLPCWRWTAASSSADAMHAQKATAQAILDRGGDYVLALKANRPALFEHVRLLLDDPAATADAVASTTDGDHGRIETRRAAIIHDVAWLAETHGFPGLKAIGKVTATRAQGGQATTASRYHLLSRRLTAARFLEVVRTHWQIENCLQLGAGRGPGRGPGPRPQGSCARKSRPPAPLRPQRPARQPHPGLTAARSNAPAGTTPSSSTSSLPPNPITVDAEVSSLGGGNELQC